MDWVEKAIAEADLASISHSPDHLRDLLLASMHMATIYVWADYKRAEPQ